MNTKVRIVLLSCMLCSPWLAYAETQRPALHGQNWMAITGKPLAVTTGAMMFQKGGNAVDAAAAMLAATSTMWDVLSWGGETQALIYHPGEKRVIGINALGVAPTGATAEFFKEKGYEYPPDTGPLAAVTPGTPGGLMTMLAEWGRLSLAEVLAPAIEMADGYPIEADTVRRIKRNQRLLRKWPATAKVFFPHPEAEGYKGPQPGEIFRQKDLAVTLRKLVETEAAALAAGKTRKEAIYTAYDRFYRGDIAEELVRGTHELGGLITLQDLDQWQVHIEEPVKTNYKGIDVYKLTTWVQGPVMLQALNMLENADLKAMGYNSTRYIHTLYQVMNHAFADRDFYYGDPYFPPVEPIHGLLSKDYARKRFEEINWERNDPDVRPGDPYPYQGGTNPFTEILEQWRTVKQEKKPGDTTVMTQEQKQKGFLMGTTAIQAADKDGWIVSVTPSGGWIPAVIAGSTGVGLSQRMQSFVLESADNPYNVVTPGKRPRVTLTPSMALKDGTPFLSFSVQAGDTQDQNLLQFFLNMVEWEMTPQEAAEAANITSYQMRGSFDDHPSEPGSLLLRDDIPAWTRETLEKMGYDLSFDSRTSGPLTAIWFDVEHGTMWGAASNYGEDYGIGW
jgi:gamma-glutamyltranspeptidase/glutathione hydrolase